MLYVGFSPQIVSGAVAIMGFETADVCFEAATLLLDGASYSGAGLYPRDSDRSKIMLMAGRLPNTKRFRHGRPDRGRS